jgi:hypothetical protein
MEKTRLAETSLWAGDSVELALAEKDGLLCIGAQSGYSGAKRWEDKYPEAADTLRFSQRLNLNKTQRFRVLLPIRD